MEVTVMSIVTHLKILGHPKVISPIPKLLSKKEKRLITRKVKKFIDLLHSIYLTRNHKFKGV